MEYVYFFQIIGIVFGLILPGLWVIEKTCKIVHFLIKLLRFVKEILKAIFGFISYRTDDGLIQSENQKQALEVRRNFVLGQFDNFFISKYSFLFSPVSVTVHFLVPFEGIISHCMVTVTDENKKINCI